MRQCSLLCHLLRQVNAEVWSSVYWTVVACACGNNENHESFTGSQTGVDSDEVPFGTLSPLCFELALFIKFAVNGMNEGGRPVKVLTMCKVSVCAIRVVLRCKFCVKSVDSHASTRAGSCCQSPGLTGLGLGPGCLWNVQYSRRFWKHFPVGMKKHS